MRKIAFAVRAYIRNFPFRSHDDLLTKPEKEILSEQNSNRTIPIWTTPFVQIERINFFRFGEIVLIG